jgi:hypothetical protein
VGVVYWTSIHHNVTRTLSLKKVIDEFALLFYYDVNTGKEVIENFDEF